VLCLASAGYLVLSWRVRVTYQRGSRAAQHGLGAAGVLALVGHFL
jgi:hypothetical protein